MQGGQRAIRKKAASEAAFAAATRRTRLVTARRNPIGALSADNTASLAAYFARNSLKTRMSTDILETPRRRVGYRAADSNSSPSAVAHRLCTGLFYATAVDSVDRIWLRFAKTWLNRRKKFYLWFSNRDPPALQAADAPSRIGFVLQNRRPFSSLVLWRLSKAHSRPTAVLGDELDSTHLQCSLDCFNRPLP